MVQESHKTLPINSHLHSLYLYQHDLETEKIPQTTQPAHISSNSFSSFTQFQVSFSLPQISLTQEPNILLLVRKYIVQCKYKLS